MKGLLFEFKFIHFFENANIMHLFFTLILFCHYLLIINFNYFTHFNNSLILLMIILFIY